MKQLVTMQSLNGRIRRALEKIGLKLIKNSPTNRLAQGDYTLVNFNTGTVQRTHLNIEEFAREYEVLKPYEQLK